MIHAHPLLAIRNLVFEVIIKLAQAIGMLWRKEQLSRGEPPAGAKAQARFCSLIGTVG